MVLGGTLSASTGVTVAGGAMGVCPALPVWLGASRPFPASNGARYRRHSSCWRLRTWTRIPPTITSATSLPCASAVTWRTTALLTAASAGRRYSTDVRSAICSAGRIGYRLPSLQLSDLHPPSGSQSKLQLSDISPDQPSERHQVPCCRAITLDPCPREGPPSIICLAGRRLSVSARGRRTRPWGVETPRQFTVGPSANLAGWPPRMSKASA